MTTYQDYLAAPSPLEFLLNAVSTYKTSAEFQRALEAQAYFRAENPTVMQKTILRAGKLESRDAQGLVRTRPVTQDVVGNRVSSAFLFRFVTQQNQFLLAEGPTMSAEARAALGEDFDRVLSHLGETALVQGGAWGFWNADHLEVIELAKNALSGFLPLLDEMDGRIRLGVQFWQLEEQRPMYLRVFDEYGTAIWRVTGRKLDIAQPLTPYIRLKKTDALGEELIPTQAWDELPLIPLWANPEHRSELTPGIRAKIDAYDRILSDFADNLDRANDVYWVLNNFGGTSEDIACLLEEISRLKAVASISDGSGSASAEPHTIEVPYEARRVALQLLERALYQDYMALDMSELTGGSLTNVAIRVATANLNLKSDRYEWQILQFLHALCRLLGLTPGPIRFRRQAIANESETIRDIAAMRADITHRKALELNPYIQPEEVDAMEAEAEAEGEGGKLPF